MLETCGNRLYIFYERLELAFNKTQFCQKFTGLNMYFIMVHRMA